MKHKGEIVLALVALIWGSSFVIVKNAVDELSVSYLLALRFTIGFVFLALIFHKNLLKADKETIKAGLIIGVILFMAYFVQTMGITDTTPGKNAFLTATYCVIVPFMSWIVTKHKPASKQFVSAFICLVGIGFVSLSNGFSVGFGDTLTLISSLFYAAQIVAITVLTKDKDYIAIGVIQLFSCMVLSWCVTLVTPNSITPLSTNSLFAILVLGILVTGIALLLQMYGQKYTNPSTASLLMSLEAVFGVICSIIFYHEPLTFKIVLGFCLIFIAIIITEVNIGGKRCE